MLATGEWAMEHGGIEQPDGEATSRHVQVGVWIRLDAPKLRGFVGFTYVDAEAGFSARGSLVRGDSLQGEATITVRQPQSVGEWRVLDDAEIDRLGVPARPSWVDEFYSPQPAAGSTWGWWRDHPRLKGRFHPEAADDFQVVVHDGGPRLSDRRAEIIWVRVVGGDDTVFRGTVLNQPHHLQSVSQYDEIKFVAPEGFEHGLMVTDKYLAERPDWVIRPCEKCGLSELFDAPSDLSRVVFPDTPADCTMQMFTAFCGYCGGVLIVQHKDFDPGFDEAPTTAPAIQTKTLSPHQAKRKKWWELWK